MRRTFLRLLPLLAPMAAGAAPGPGDTPREALRRFDSLLQAGAEAEARALCAGTALRMFPFLAEAQRKLAPFLDTARSKDTVLEELCSGSWCALKVFSRAKFHRPLMGMDSLNSVQAVHLFRSSGAWRLAEFEELTDAGATLTPRTGVPGEAGPDSAGLLPVSRRAPDRAATRLRLKLTLRSGEALALPEGPGQKVSRQGKAALVETRRVELPGSPSPLPSPPPDSLLPYLASGPYLDLSDTLLVAQAHAWTRNSGSAAAAAEAIYRGVSSRFSFGLGVVLFGDSRQVLRSMKGDCSEAAVLTAALLRAAGIPSRVALGFATLGRGVFIGHAWTEAFVDGTWVGVDAALKEFPAGANRVLLARLSGYEDMRVAATNLMIRHLSNLDIEITAAWSGKKALPLREQKGNAAEGRAFFEEVLRGMGKD